MAVTKHGRGENSGWSKILKWKISLPRPGGVGQILKVDKMYAQRELFEKCRLCPTFRTLLSWGHVPLAISIVTGLVTVITGLCLAAWHVDELHLGTSSRIYSSLIF